MNDNRYFYVICMITKGGSNWQVGAPLMTTHYPGINQIDDLIRRSYNYDGFHSISLTNIIEFKNEVDYKSFQTY